MPKLLQINSTCNVGSTGRIAEQILSLAETKGWSCYYAHGGRYVNRSKFHTIQVSSKLDNLFHAFLGEFLGMHGFGSYFATKRFIKQINQIKPDIIHLHNVHGYYINIRVLFNYLAQANIPVVWTLHDCWSFTGHCTHFEREGCVKWKTKCGNCPLLMAQYKSRFVDRSQKNYLIKKTLYSKLNNVTITPVSQWLGNLVSQSILKQFPIQVVNNGIDLDVFKPTISGIRNRLGIPDNKKIVLGVVSTGFDDEKGRKDFCEFSKEKDWQVVLVGLKAEEMVGLPNNIICINRTNSQSELAEYYSEADVFVNPTYNDTFPTTNIEALACGTPVITYRTGGSPDSLDEETGVVLEQGDIEGMKEAIYRVIRKGKSSFSEKCRNRAVRLYNKNDRYLDYINIYENILNSKK